MTRGVRPASVWPSVAGHAVLALAAYVVASVLAADGRPGTADAEFLGKTAVLVVALKLVTFAGFDVYRPLWRYVSAGDLAAIVKASVLGDLLFAGAVVPFPRARVHPSLFPLDALLCIALVAGTRLALRARAEAHPKVSEGARRAVVVGAGDGGELLLREMSRNPDLDYDIVAFVDDDPRKRGRRIRGVTVAGGLADLADVARRRRAEEILIAIPSATPEQRRSVVVAARLAGIPMKTVPALADLVEGRARIGNLQVVRPEDLLVREAVRIDTDGLRAELRGRTVLVTGAAGSIGSELCRQIAVFEPKRLVLFDRAESPLYFVDLELRHAFPGVEVVPVIGDVCDEARAREIVEMHAPYAVYHAAAYKHVPLMQEHPLEAIRNNVFGTEVVARAAQRAGVSKFVLISTDKAVHPVGVMGMTKRVAEDVLRSLGNHPTVFVAVRFGNVLGSEGSVLPLFQKQMARGGPITVTDPEATRYFMLISEAAQLVLQAGHVGRPGDLLFLDMGKPVRIGQLAEDLIRLSGLEPDSDVAIEIVGLRPGERLSEELVHQTEALEAGAHERVFVARHADLDAEAFARDLDDLRRATGARAVAEAVDLLAAMAERY